MPTADTKFLIRPFVPADLQACGSLAADAFIDDDVFGRFMHPHRREYWDDYIGSWKGRLEKVLEEGGDVFVAVEQQNEGEEKVVGWAAWCVMDMRPAEQSSAEKGEAVVVQVTPLADATHVTISAESGPLDKSSSPSNIAIFEAAKPYADHLWSGPFAACYHLDLLCIAPSSQGHGYGAAMMKYGIAEAEKRDLAGSVIAAWEREGFYGRYGFVEKGRADVGPLGGLVKGGAVMFRDVKV